MTVLLLLLKYQEIGKNLNIKPLADYFPVSLHHSLWETGGLQVVGWTGGEVQVWVLTRMFCCVLGQSTFLSQCLLPRSINGYQRELSENEILRGGRVGLTLDWYPIQGVAVIFLVDSCYRNRVFLQHSSGWTDHLAQVQTSSLPFLISFFILQFFMKILTVHREKVY